MTTSTFLEKMFTRIPEPGDFIWWFHENDEDEGLENSFTTDTERTNYSIGQIVKIVTDHDYRELKVKINSIRLDDPKDSFFDENRELIISFSYA